MAKNACINKTLTLFSFSCIAALFAAYISEYFFGLKPCALCLYQRIPFFSIVFLLVFAYLFFRNSQKILKFIGYVCVLLFILNAAIGAYHVGVEEGFFELTQKCQDNIEAKSITELKMAIKFSSLAKCDDVQFRFLGLSMAGWNVIYCLGLAIFGILCLRRVRNY